MRLLGIDPGAVSGGWALLTRGVPGLGGTSDCGDLPSVDGQFNPGAFAALVEDLKPTVAVVEMVNAFPKQGVSSSFKFGRAYGAILGVLAAKGIETHLVSPVVWKRSYRLSGKDKNKSRARATMLYPACAKLLSRVKDDGRAEALLIARWYQDKLGN